MASDGISRVVLPQLMQAVGRVAPKMRFTVHPGDPRRLSEYLRDGDFDLALAFVRRRRGISVLHPPHAHNSAPKC